MAPVTKPLPSLDLINKHVWALATLVHPHTQSDDYLAWVQRVLHHYGIEARTIDGALSYEWAVLLWTCLCNTEQEKCNRLAQLYGAEREANSAV